MIDDGGDRRLYSSSSVSCFYPFLLLTTGNCQHLAVVTFVALVNGSLLRKAGLLLRALPPPLPPPLWTHTGCMFDVFAILHRPVYRTQ